MLLEELVDDPAEVSRVELQEMINARFSGADRTRAVLELCSIHRLWRHKRWIQNLIATSDSEDIAEAVAEWNPAGTQVQPAVFVRLGRTDCFCDGTPIKNVYVYRNNRTDGVIHIGSVCAEKIDTRNIFGDARISGGRSDSEGGLDHVFVSAIDWLDGQQDTPAEILEIVHALKQDGEISLVEKDRIMHYYDTHRMFYPSELVGEREISTLRVAFGNVRGVLPKDLANILYTNDQVTRDQARPLLDFVYENHSALIERIRSDRNARKVIDRERAKLNVMIPDLRKKGLRLLEYMADYEEVNENRMHRLSGLVLPIKLFNAGFLMTAEDADAVEKAYQRHGGYTVQQLEIQRDDRFAKRRVRKWGEIRTASDRQKVSRAFVADVYAELNRMGREEPELADDIWRVVNGVMKSRIANSRTGYSSSREMLARGDGHFLERNLVGFLTAGYVGSDFMTRDAHFYSENIENNLPETLMGRYSQYRIPWELRHVAYEDAATHPSQRKREKLMTCRRNAMDVFEGLVMEKLRRFKFR